MIIAKSWRYPLGKERRWGYMRLLPASLICLKKIRKLFILGQRVYMLFWILFFVLHCRGTAVTTKRMLETSFPGIHVILRNYPPPFPKRVLSKVIPIVQVGAIATILAGDQIFPRLGMVPPPWYYSLRANRFGTTATIWLFGNFAQSFLQSSGAFEVYCNGDLVCFLC